MFQHLFNAEMLLVGLSVWGFGVALYLLRMYVRRQSLYQTRVHSRVVKIGNPSFRAGEKPKR
jgi:hypothetical protein